MSCSAVGRVAFAINAGRGLPAQPGTRLFGPARRSTWRPRRCSHQQCRVASSTEPQQASSAPDAATPVNGAAPAAATVTFKACRRVEFGQVLRVVGGPEELGSWDANKAPAMSWGEGDQWTLVLQLPPGQHEFKMVVTAAGGYSNWEGGANRSLQLPATQGPVTVVCAWGQTGSLEVLSSADEEAAPAVGALSDSESDVPALRPEDLSAEPYSAAGDEGEEPTSVGKMTVEGAAEEPAPPQAAEGSAAAVAAEVGKMTIEGGAKADSPGAAAGATLNGAGAAVKMEAGDYPSQTPVSMAEQQQQPQEAVQQAEGSPAAGPQVAAATVLALAAAAALYYYYAPELDLPLPASFTAALSSISLPTSLPPSVSAALSSISLPTLPTSLSDLL